MSTVSKKTEEIRGQELTIEGRIRVLACRDLKQGKAPRQLLPWLPHSLACTSQVVSSQKPFLEQRLTAYNGKQCWVSVAEPHSPLSCMCDASCQRAHLRR